ncbi:MAG: hypothetical protein NZ929_04355 [Aigarchaeota archaeon]|nr:hypothetical protein [Aigarchaeota archaeon]MCX8192718.1 hypothetical protein [Nitrososphaeria archaeon]MDW7985970.1 hypothetical protein [Nitrososphaerota archaeon]
MSEDIIIKHYMKDEVLREIVDFSIGKWIAVHCAKTDESGEQLMFRYYPKTGKPLKISSPEDVKNLLIIFERFSPRTFYASINVYKRLEVKEDILDRINIVASTPTWDIDPLKEDYNIVIRSVEELVSKLDSLGVSRSVIVKWSGRGAHVHIHPNAFSPKIYRKIHPLDVAYSVTEYVLRKMSNYDNVKIENKIDLGRVFTIPLSIHRRLNRVSVCINVNEIWGFDLSWTDINSFRHDSSWRDHIVGEGDDLAERAFREIGPYLYKGRKKRVSKPLDKQILETLEKFKDVV